MTRDKAYIDPDKCRECGQCYNACPYNAIVDIMRPCRRACPVDAIQAKKDGRVKIDDEKCIRCGSCISACPFGAISDSSRMLEVIDYLKSDKPVYALVAPAAEGQFGVDITMESIRTAVKKMGFKDMVDVAIGADFVSDSEAKEWAEAYNEGKKMTTSCCPAFVNMVYKHYPELKDHVSTTVSPMCGVSRMIKSIEPDAYTVFIGPCIAKKSEVKDQKIEGNADAVLTYSEIRTILKVKDIALEPAENEYQESSIFGKRFGNSGGVTEAVLQCLKETDQEMDAKVCRANGAAECKKALLLMKVGKLPEDFIEGMACNGGCVGGPSAFENQIKSKKSRDALLSQADDRTVHGNLDHYGMDKFSMHRA